GIACGFNGGMGTSADGAAPQIEFTRKTISPPDRARLRSGVALPKAAAASAALRQLARGMERGGVPAIHPFHLWSRIGCDHCAPLRRTSFRIRVGPGGLHVQVRN